MTDRSDHAAPPGLPGGPGGAVDLMAVGESMVLFTPDPPRPLVEASSVAIHVGGAESNVATYMADLGYRAQWASLVGDDPFGRIILATLTDAGIDVSPVETVAGAPTGLYVKDPGELRTSVYYFRANSAASTMTPAFLERALTARPRVLHLSGVTAALSDSARETVRAGLDLARDGSPVVTFDVNYRPALWTAEEASPVLADLADRSDVTFVGLDEAGVLWGCRRPEDVRDMLPHAGRVVVKDGAVGAYTFGGSGTTFEPSISVEVVEPVGAGDAFAAGYLAAMLEGCPEPQRLRMGHLTASAALVVSSDHGPLPDVEELRTMRVLDADRWSALRFAANTPLHLKELEQDHV
jgi:2-dehydro-3-deoxygluconokinase